MPRKKKTKVLPQEGFDIEVPTEETPEELPKVEIPTEPQEELMSEFVTHNKEKFQMFLKGTTYILRNGHGQLIAQGLTEGQAKHMMENLRRFA